MGNFVVRPLTITDRNWVTQRIIESWGSEIVVAHKKIFRPANLPGFVVQIGEKLIGLLTYHLSRKACEIVTLDSLSEGQGVGRELIERVKQVARREGCNRLWLITTNDNTHALRFYQKQGFTLTGVRINAIKQARKIKQDIPLYGKDGIPIRDELKLEIWI
jgi:GNAT superfamily N-acetyltransferase